jgi:hypothetical protein
VSYATATPWARSPEWQHVARLLPDLVELLDAWAAAVLVPVSPEALHCVAHFRLPGDWVEMHNRLDSGGMNARAFTSAGEVVDNDGIYKAPPTDAPLSLHHISASAVVLVPEVGTLEVLANRAEYRFEGPHLLAMRATAQRIADLVNAV